MRKQLQQNDDNQNFTKFRLILASKCQMLFPENGNHDSTSPSFTHVLKDTFPKSRKL